MQLGDTEAYKKKIMEETKGLGKGGVKGDMKDCFLFDSWFATQRSAESSMDF